MFLFVMIFGLIFLVAGGVGVFYVNTNLTSSAPIWVIGNITFGTFILVGIGILIFLAIFNAEFD
jgi:hypothetical protein